MDCAWLLPSIFDQFGNGRHRFYQYQQFLAGETNVMPPVTELLILRVCFALICIKMQIHPKQPDPTRVKNPEKFMWIGMFVSCGFGLAAYTDARFFGSSRKLGL
jgi:drug/metabolite transporter (DMT)-like permease